MPASRASRWRTVVLSATLVVACARSDATTRGPWAGLEVTPARPKPAFALTATNGQPFDFRRETDGYLTLLFFGYTNCPDVCPVHFANIAAALKTLSVDDRARVRVVFVTTDPARDSLARIRAWLDNFDRTFVGLRGTIEEVTTLEQMLGLAPSIVDDQGGGDYSVGHAAQVLAFTPDDSLRFYYPFGVRQADWAADIPRLIAIDAGK